jgi:hypothetical protein
MKLDNCLGSGKEKFLQAEATLRRAGMEKGRNEYECNWCGERLVMADMIAVERGGVPVLVHRNCAIEGNLKIL